VRDREPALPRTAVVDDHKSVVASMVNRRAGMVLAQLAWSSYVSCAPATPWRRIQVSVVVEWPGPTGWREVLMSLARVSWWRVG
jgi:hypothetical protein